MSELNKLFEDFKKESLSYDPYEDDIYLKFPFAFALQKITSECHSGQWSELYALGSALSLEWDFSMGMASYDSEDYGQVEAFEWLKEKLGVSDLYKEEEDN